MGGELSEKRRVGALFRWLSAVLLEFVTIQQKTLTFTDGEMNAFIQ